MLERVALGQSRFMTPGVASDPRGVLLGRFGLLMFPTLEGVVSWFRLYSAESSLDELLAGLQILRLSTPLRSREMAVRIPASSSYAMDRASRCAKLVGGTTYTGSNKHFVKYRDERSPYGYDATEIGVLPAGAAFMLHADDFTQTYKPEGTIGFEELLYRLSLRRKPGADKLNDEDRAELVLVVARGLGEGVVRYLWRNRVEAEAGVISPGGDSAFDAFGRKNSYLLFRVHDLPARILELFLSTPGIDVFRAVTPNVAVSVGYEHVFDLGSCASVFDAEKFYLMWGSPDRVDIVDGALELSSIEHLTSLEIDLERPQSGGELDLAAAAPVGVPIKLAPSLTSSRHVVGTLVPLAKAEWIKRLIYALPRTSLRGHRVAVTDRGVLLVADSDLDVILLGQLLVGEAPGLLVPAGMDLVPRVAPDVLAKALGHGAGVLTVFPLEGTPFQVSEAAMAPLERRALAKIEVARVGTIDMSTPLPGDPSVVNDPVGRFALWGFRAPEANEQ